MGPNERDALAVVAEHTIVGDDLSERLAAAAVLAARAVDRDPSCLFPYAGRAVDVRDRLLQELATGATADDFLAVLRARHVGFRAALRGVTVSDAEMAERMAARMHGGALPAP